MSTAIRTIKLRRGLKVNLPALETGEPAFVTDEKEIYIGTSTGNEMLTSRQQIDTLQTIKADKTEINTLASAKADTTYVDTKVASVASGSPKSQYATLALLQAAFPTGTTGIYLVTADGKWYYWTGSAWTAGGLYQATGLPDTVALKSDTDLSLINRVNNGNFGSVAGWSGSGSTISASNNILSVTGNGTAAAVYVYTTTTIPFVAGKIIYIKITAKVTNSDCLRFEVYVKGSLTGSLTQIRTLVAPVNDTYYIISHNPTLPAGHTGNLMLYINHLYTNSAAANGKVMCLQYVSAIDVMEAFGAGNELSLLQMGSLLNHFSNSWFADRAKSNDFSQAMLQLIKVQQNDISLAQAYNYLTTPIKGTSQIIVKNTDGTINRVTHYTPGNVTIRTDAFTYAANLITEIRTLNTGETLTFFNHLDTLITEVV